jgi:predicted nuclease of predicted toxin-antitoxin system
VKLLFPPKVIWLNVGNAGTRAIGELLIRERGRVEAFSQQTEAPFLILSLEQSRARERMAQAATRLLPFGNQRA